MAAAAQLKRNRGKEQRSSPLSLERSGFDWFAAAAAALVNLFHRPFLVDRRIACREKIRLKHWLRFDHFCVVVLLLRVKTAETEKTFADRNREHLRELSA